MRWVLVMLALRERGVRCIFGVRGGGKDIRLCKIL
jgi:hypothetical protein